MQSHPILSIPFYASVAFERAAYYGLRACFVIFLVSETINMSRMDAFTMYGFVTGVVAISYLLGGVLGLLKQPKIVALSGMGLQLIGTLVVAFSTEGSQAYTGFSLIAFGVGIHKPNMVAFLGQLYNRSKLLDSAVNINYVMVNIGATLGVLFVVRQKDDFGFRMAFLLCAAFLVVAIVLLFLSNNEHQDEQEIKQTKSGELVFLPIVIVLALGGSIFYWMTVELTTPDLVGLSENYSELKRLAYPFSRDVNFIVILVLGAALALVYSFYKVSTNIQLAVGFFCAMLSMVLIFDFTTANGPASSSAAFILISFYILQTIAEVLIGPPIYAYMLQKIDIMYVSLVIGGAYFLTAICMRLSTYFWEQTLFEILEWGTWMMLFFGGAFLIIYFVSKPYRDEDSTTHPIDDTFI